MLVLVVGPSGAGKDTLLDLARAALTDDGRFRFVRRVITRPAVSGGEDHEAVDAADFARRDFALQWDAHGLRYGIPRDAEHDIARGHVVVASVSRSVIADAAARYPTRVVVVDAPAHLRAARLAARGREGAADVARRLTRDVPLPAGIAMDNVANDGTPAQGAARFLAALNRAAESVRR